MTVQEDDRLYSDPRLVDFYDLENGWGSDTRYCAELARTAGSVLDFGCGTGLFLAGIADGRPMVGVDPAAAMLDVARRRPNGEFVRWVEDDIRNIRLGERFDLVTMTGHAFQCLLTDADVAAALDTIAAHLTPSGQFIFDSRNPARREWEGWTPEASRRIVAHPSTAKSKAGTTSPSMKRPGLSAMKPLIGWLRAKRCRRSPRSASSTSRVSPV